VRRSRRIGVALSRKRVEQREVEERDTRRINALNEQVIMASFRLDVVNEIATLTFDMQDSRANALSKAVTADARP
jgi:hypothetical protein